MVVDSLGEKEQALAFYQQALPLWRQVGDIRGEANALAHLGDLYATIGHLSRRAPPQ